MSVLDREKLCSVGSSDNSKCRDREANVKKGRDRTGCGWMWEVRKLLAEHSAPQRHSSRPLLASAVSDKDWVRAEHGSRPARLRGKRVVPSLCPSCQRAHGTLLLSPPPFRLTVSFIRCCWLSIPTYGREPGPPGPGHRSHSAMPLFELAAASLLVAGAKLADSDSMTSPEEGRRGERGRTDSERRPRTAQHVNSVYSLSLFPGPDWARAAAQPRRRVRPGRPGPRLGPGL